MAHLKAGYWPTTYWAEDYYDPDYWPQWKLVLHTLIKVAFRHKKAAVAFRHKKAAVAIEMM